MVKNGEICKFWDPIHHKKCSPFFTISIVICSILSRYIDDFISLPHKIPQSIIQQIFQLTSEGGGGGGGSCFVSVRYPVFSKRTKNRADKNGKIGQKLLRK